MNLYIKLIINRNLLESFKLMKRKRVVKKKIKIKIKSIRLKY